MASDPTVCPECNQPFEDGDQVATIVVERVRDPNGDLEFETEHIERRLHNNCP